MPSRLSRVYMQQAKLVRDRGRAAASRAFMALPAVDDDHFEEWLDGVRPVTNATSTASASLAQAFIYSAAVVVIYHALDASKYTQEQIGVTPFGDRYRDPFIGFYNALGNGKNEEDARAIGASRAGLVVDSDARGASPTMMGDAAARVEAESTRRLRGYARIPEPDACSFCELAATRTY